MASTPGRPNPSKASCCQEANDPLGENVRHFSRAPARPVGLLTPSAGFQQFGFGTSSGPAPHTYQGCGRRQCAAAALGAFPGVTWTHGCARGPSPSTPRAWHARLPSSECRARGRGRPVSQAWAHVAEQSRSGTDHPSTRQDAGIDVWHRHRWCGRMAHAQERRRHRARVARIRCGST